MTAKKRKLRPLRLSDLLDQRIWRDLDARYPYGWRLLITEEFKIEIRYREAAP